MFSAETGLSETLLGPGKTLSSLVSKQGADNISNSAKPKISFTRNPPKLEKKAWVKLYQEFRDINLMQWTNLQVVLSGELLEFSILSEGMFVPENSYREGSLKLDSVGLSKVSEIIFLQERF